MAKGTRRIFGAWLLASVAALGGCSSEPRRDPQYAASLPAVRPRPDQRPSGAIYQAGYSMALFEDLRARRIGDTLTIKLVEKTDASKSASSTVAKETTASVDNPKVLGTSVEFDVPGFLPLASTSKNTPETSLHSKHEFSGAGDNTQKNSLSGEITVTVADVLPNGNLVVRGEKRLNLNQGNEYLKISGIVRPIDIGPDNSVPSTKVADATIIYTGDGQTAAANRLAWLARFFIGALFPF